MARTCTLSRKHPRLRKVPDQLESCFHPNANHRLGCGVVLLISLVPIRDPQYANSTISPFSNSVTLGFKVYRMIPVFGNPHHSPSSWQALLDWIGGARKEVIPPIAQN